jgi:hypothetical protein
MTSADLLGRARRLAARNLAACGMIADLSGIHEIIRCMLHSTVTGFCCCLEVCVGNLIVSR